MTTVLFFEPRPIPGRRCVACGNPEVIRQGPEPLCGVCAFLQWRAWVEMLERRHGSPWEPRDGMQPTFSGRLTPWANRATLPP